jgi:uncharacterized protein
MTPAPIMLPDDLAAAPGSPGIVRSPLELDGYLTAIIVTPQADPILPSKWIAGLWSEEEPIFDDTATMRSVLGAVVERYSALNAQIERSLDRLEAERVCDYRPLFLAQGSRPSHDSVRRWARGFWKAMALAPGTWTTLMEGERGQTLMRPFIGFFDHNELQPFEIEPPETIDDILDEDAAAIPHMILILRKLGRLRAANPSAPLAAPRPRKPGRNDPCPCGSGQKYKRCCGRN